MLEQSAPVSVGRGHLVFPAVTRRRIMRQVEVKSPDRAVTCFVAGLLGALDCIAARDAGQGIGSSRARRQLTDQALPLRAGSVMRHGYARIVGT